MISLVLNTLQDIIKMSGLYYINFWLWFSGGDKGGKGEWAEDFSFRVCKVLKVGRSVWTSD